MASDPIDHIGAVTRAVESRTHNGKSARVIVATRVFDTDIADAWDAITSAERIPRWFLPVSGDLTLGGRYALKGNASGQITQCEPPRALGLTWEFGGEVSWVQVRLTEVNAAQTRLDLEHIAHVDDDRWNQFGPGAVGVGWDMTLMGLAMHFTSSPAVTPETAGAWMVSDEGKAMMRASSNRWRDASVAAGANPDSAKAAADRTSAFYTGSTDG